MVEILGLAQYLVLLQLAAALVLHMHTDQLQQILQVVAVVAVAVQPKT
jgi:hypothetical protein